MPRDPLLYGILLAVAAASGLIFVFSNLKVQRIFCLWAMRYLLTSNHLDTRHCERNLYTRPCFEFVMTVQILRTGSLGTSSVCSTGVNPHSGAWRIEAETHWSRDKMAAISQTTFSNACSLMKMFKFRLKFHWSLFTGVQLTIFQHWFW